MLRSAGRDVASLPLRPSRSSPPRWPLRPLRTRPQSSRSSTPCSRSGTSTVATDPSLGRRHRSWRCLQPAASLDGRGRRPSLGSGCARTTAIVSGAARERAHSSRSSQDRRCCVVRRPTPPRERRHPVAAGRHRRGRVPGGTSRWSRSLEGRHRLREGTWRGHHLAGGDASSSGGSRPRHAPHPRTGVTGAQARREQAPARRRARQRPSATALRAPRLRRHRRVRRIMGSRGGRRLAVLYTTKLTEMVKVV